MSGITELSGTDSTASITANKVASTTTMAPVASALLHFSIRPAGSNMLRCGTRSNWNTAIAGARKRISPISLPIPSPLYPNTPLMYPNTPLMYPNTPLMYPRNGIIGIKKSA